MHEILDNAFTEPSGMVVSNTERYNSLFSDLSFVHQGAYFFIARGLRYGKWFALKGVNSALQDKESLKTLLYKEFELLIKLNHPNIRKALSLEEIEGLGECMVMEFTEGCNLRQWLQQPRSLSARVRVACEVADALDYIHKKETVHRDIKPENIIITHIGETAKIIDFGLSDSDQYAVYKHPAGTPEYTSPEQATSSIPEPSNDIYSLGILLKTLLPEKRFKKLIQECTGSVERRPDSAYIKERLLKLAERKNPLSIILFVISVLAALTLLFAILPLGKNDNAGFEPPLITNNEASVETGVSSKGEETGPVKVYDKGNKEAVEMPVKNEQSKNVFVDNPPQSQQPYSAQLSIEIFLKEGKNSMDKAAAALKDSKRKSDSQADASLSEEDYEVMRKVKESYIKNLKFLMENSPTFGETYIFGKAELSRVDKGLEEELENYFGGNASVKNH